MARHLMNRLFKLQFLGPSWLRVSSTSCFFGSAGRTFQHLPSSPILQNIDDWLRKQDDLPSRPKAIRRLVELGLKVKNEYEYG